MCQRNDNPLGEALATADGLDGAAAHCGADRQVLATRLRFAATTIRDLVAKLERAEFSAQLNKETIVESRR